MDKKRINYLIILILPLLAVLLLTLFFKVFVVKTPSMGTAAPVGSLVLVQKDSDYKQEEIITFKHKDRYYTHRIFDKNNEGYTTKGDINGSSDPWIVKESDIVGEAKYIIPFAGWAWRMIPPLLIGWIMVYLLSKFIKKSYYWRWSARIFGSSMVLALVVLWLKPWLNFALINFHAVDENLARFNIVNTGVFPIWADGNIFYNGEVASVLVSKEPDEKFFYLYPKIALFDWWIVLAVLICLSPLLVSYIVYLCQPKEKFIGLNYFTNKHKFSSLLSNTFIVSVVYFIITIILALSFTSSGALTASVQNTQNVATTNRWFTCRAAEVGTPNRLFAWALGTTGTSEMDIGGSSFNGTSTVSKTISPSFGCVRDNPRNSVNFSNQCINQTSTVAVSNPQTFTLEAWFRTSNTSNGKIIGFNSGRTGFADSTYDRHIYIDNSGRVVFGVYNGSVQTVSSLPGVNYADGNWHHVVATLSGGTMSIYLNGVLQSSKSGVSAQVFNGFWRVGCGRLGGWQNANGSGYNGPDYFTGNLQYVAVYTRALTPVEVTEHYYAGK